MAQRQERVMVEIAPGGTVLEAILASGLRERLPQMDLVHVGVWGRQVSLATGLREGDRVEIYRPLIADPKSVRRERAAKARK